MLIFVEFPMLFFPGNPSPRIYSKKRRYETHPLRDQRRIAQVNVNTQWPSHPADAVKGSQRYDDERKSIGRGWVTGGRDNRSLARDSHHGECRTRGTGV